MRTVLWVLSGEGKFMHTVLWVLTYILECLLPVLQPSVGGLQRASRAGQLILQLDDLLLQRLHLLLGLRQQQQRHTHVLQGLLLLLQALVGVHELLLGLVEVVLQLLHLLLQLPDLLLGLQQQQQRHAVSSCKEVVRLAQKV